MPSQVNWSEVTAAVTVAVVVDLILGLGAGEARGIESTGAVCPGRAGRTGPAGGVAAHTGSPRTLHLQS